MFSFPISGDSDNFSSCGVAINLQQGTVICPEVRMHEADMARADTILIYTLGERFAHTQAVGKLKAQHDLPASDPAREATQIARLEQLAKDAELDPAFAKKFLTFVIAEVIQHHKQHAKPLGED